jgi:hypothetical protein
MTMTLPALINRLRSYVVFFDASNCVVRLDGKPIKAFDQELEPALPPPGFDRRILALNITTESSGDGVDADDPSFDAAADAKWWGKWKK